MASFGFFGENQQGKSSPLSLLWLGVSGSVLGKLTVAHPNHPLAAPGSSWLSLFWLPRVILGSPKAASPMVFCRPATVSAAVLKPLRATTELSAEHFHRPVLALPLKWTLISSSCHAMAPSACLKVMAMVCDMLGSGGMSYLALPVFFGCRSPFPGRQSPGTS